MPLGGSLLSGTLRLTDETVSCSPPYSGYKNWFDADRSASRKYGSVGGIKQQDLASNLIGSEQQQDSYALNPGTGSVDFYENTRL